MDMMNDYGFNEGIEFNGLIPEVMEADGISTIGASDFNAMLFKNGQLGSGSLEVRGGGVNPEPKPDTHEYVDLGLTSGTLWATENIKDANGNELYFAWGGTQGYTAEQVGNGEGKRAFSFSWEDYEFGNPPSKYNDTDGKAILDTSDDAATVNWGSDWRMPTKGKHNIGLDTS